MIDRALQRSGAATKARLGTYALRSELTSIDKIRGRGAMIGFDVVKPGQD